MSLFNVQYSKCFLKTKNSVSALMKCTELKERGNGEGESVSVKVGLEGISMLPCVFWIDSNA